MHYEDFIRGLILWALTLVKDIIQGVLWWIHSVLPGWIPGVRSTLWWIRSLFDILVEAHIVDAFLSLVMALMVMAIAFGSILNLIWLEKKILARIQGRVGPRVAGPYGHLQTFADAFKLFAKEIIHPKGADKVIFMVATMILASVVFMLIALVPLSPDFSVSRIQGGSILVLAMFMLIPMAAMSGGWASNTSGSSSNGLRTGLVMGACGVPMLVAMIVPVFLARSLDFQVIVAYQASLGIYGYLVYLGTAFISMFMFIVASSVLTRREPFGNVDSTGLARGGWDQEYGGCRRLVIRTAEYFLIFFASVVVVILFLVGWAGPAFLPPVMWMVLKVHGVFFIFIWVRASLTDLGTHQALELGWKRLFPLSFLGFFLAATMKVMGVLP